MDTDALKASWAAVAPNGARAAQYFYAALFSWAPELRGMFPPVMAGQRDKLLDALGYIVSNVDDGEALLAFVRQLGADHRRFSVQPEHYPLVGRALLHTLGVGLGEAWTAELAADWAAAYDLVAETMVAAAKEREAVESPWWDAEVVAHERRTGDIAVVTVRPVREVAFRPGQSVAVESHLRERVWRHLSPANAPRLDGTIEFHIRAVAGGQFSPAMVYQARCGDILRLGAPIGSRLTVPAGPGPDLLLLAGGTGLAPFKAIIEQLMAELDGRKVTLVVGAAYRHELYDVSSLAALSKELRQLTVVQALSRDPGVAERATVVDAALAFGSWHDHDIYVCGSPVMVTGTCSALLDAGYSPGRVHIEQYNGTTYAPLREGLSPERVFDQVIGR